MPVCLVTGCSSGLGEAIAIALGDHGYRVVATMRDPAAASAALRSGANVEIAPLDVTDARARAAIMARVLAGHGRLDLLVNNAGVAATASMEDTPEDLSRRIFDTNYFGPVELMRAAIPVMRRQGGGRIVNVTALGALLSVPLLGVYSASKHALDSASAVVDLEGRPFGIRAPSVIPALFRTRLAEKATASVSAGYAEIAESLNAARAETPQDMLADLSPLVEAVIRAATDPDPAPRYLAGVGVLADSVRPSLDDRRRLHDFVALRSGLA